MRKNSFSINLDFFTSHLKDIEATAQRIKETGFDGILFYLDIKRLAQNQIGKVHAAMRNNGLVIHQLHSPWPNLGSFNSRERNAAIATCQRWLDHALAMDAQTFVIHPGGLEEDCIAAIDKVMEFNIHSLEKIAAGAAGTNLKIAVENVCACGKNEKPRRRFGTEPAHLANLMKKLCRRRFGICLDTSHALSARVSAEDFILQIQDRLITTHLHDTTGHYDEHLLPGGGIIPWQKFLSTLKAARYHGPLVLEISPAIGGNPREKCALLKQTLKFLKNQSC